VAAKRIAVKKHVVKLSDEEPGKHPARRLTKARILLKADTSEAGEGWSDSPRYQRRQCGRGPANNWWKKASRPSGSQTLRCLRQNAHFRRSRRGQIDRLDPATERPQKSRYAAYEALVDACCND
jgi:hypothetical protein